jgi:hypothetical protein
MKRDFSDDRPQKFAPLYIGEIREIACGFRAVICNRFFGLFNGHHIRPLHLAFPQIERNLLVLQLLQLLAQLRRRDDTGAIRVQYPLFFARQSPGFPLNFHCGVPVILCLARRRFVQPAKWFQDHFRIDHDLFHGQLYSAIEHGFPHGRYLFATR